MNLVHEPECPEASDPKKFCPCVAGWLTHMCEENEVLKEQVRELTKKLEGKKNGTS